MFIEKLLDKRNDTNITICQLNILIVGIQCDKEFFRGECTCFSDD